MKYEYGLLLKRAKVTSSAYLHWWEFNYGENNIIKYGADVKLNEVLNKLGKQGWKLSVKNNSNEYILVRELPAEFI